MFCWFVTLQLRNNSEKLTKVLLLIPFAVFTIHIVFPIFYFSQHWVHLKPTSISLIVKLYADYWDEVSFF